MECFNCLQTWSEQSVVPRILKCGHTICHQCLCRLFAPSGLKCPSCEQIQKIEIIRNFDESEQDFSNRFVSGLTKNIALLTIVENPPQPTSPLKKSSQLITREYIEGSICPDHHLPIHSYSVRPYALLCQSCLPEIAGMRLQVEPFTQIVSETMTISQQAKDLLEQMQRQLQQKQEELKGSSLLDSDAMNSKLDEHFQILKTGLHQAYTSAKNKLQELISAQEDSYKTNKELLQNARLQFQKVHNSSKSLAALPNDQLVKYYNDVISLSSESTQQVPEINYSNCQIEVNVKQGSISALRELVQNSYNIELTNSDETNWVCANCQQRSPEGNPRCRSCRHFRALENYPNILHNPDGVTVNEINELEQRRQIELEMISELDDPDTKGVWYLIDSNWISQWKCFIFNKTSPIAEQNSPNDRIGVLPPGPISNNKLFQDPQNPNQLKPKLKPAAHYRGINEKVWKVYYKIYGGGPVLSRRRVNIYDTPVDPPQSALDRSTL